MKIIVLIIFLLSSGWQSIFAQPKPLENGDTAQVWNHLQKNDSLFYALITQDIKEEQLDAIRVNADAFIPPVIFALAQDLFDNGSKNEAVFWYYVALLRAMNDTQQEELLFDKNKHTIFLYTQIFGKSIETYSTANIDQSEKLILAACDYVREFPALYSSSWIFLDGAENEKDLADFPVTSKNSQEIKQQRLCTVDKFEENLNKYLNGEITDKFKYK